MTEPIKPCPCGKVPTESELLIECAKRSKYGIIYCPCREWMLEFRNSYAHPADKVSAIRAWQDARRGEK